MPSLKKELRDSILSSYTNKVPDELLKRNITLIFEYFGLGITNYATLENVGLDNDGGTRENVRLVIKKLKEKIPSSLLLLKNVIEGELVRNGGYLLYEKALPILIQAGIIDSNEYLHPHGLHNLGVYLNLGFNFGIYNMRMSGKGASQIDYKNNNGIILAKQEAKETLEKEIREIRKLPGKHSKAGIYCLNVFYESNPEYLIQLDDMKIILSQMNDAWHTEMDGRFWYLVEKVENKKGNPLLTALKKFKKIGGEHLFEKQLLVDVMENFLSQRWTKGERENNDETTLIPTSNIIRQYFDESRFINSKIYDDKYVLNEKLGSNISLGPVEQGLWDYFRNRDVSTLGEITDHLKNLGGDLGALTRSSLLVEIQNNKIGKDREFVFITKYDNKKFNSLSQDNVDKVSSGLGPKKNRQEFDDESSRNKKNIGYKGEKLVFHHLQGEKNISNLKWISEEYPRAPYDITFTDNDNHTCYIDVKSTEGNFNNKIYISYTELLAMQDYERYQIYRVYDVNESYTKAYLQISENLQNFAKGIVEILSKLSQEISSDGISLSPNVLKFGAAIPITYALTSSDDTSTVHRLPSTVNIP